MLVKSVMHKHDIYTRGGSKPTASTVHLGHSESEFEGLSMQPNKVVVPSIFVGRSGNWLSGWSVIGIGVTSGAYDLHDP